MLVNNNWDKDNIEDILNFDVKANEEINNEKRQLSKKPTYVPVGLVSRQIEQEELGHPQSQSNCFFCSYMGEDVSGSVAVEEVIKLREFIRKNTGRKNPIDVCQFIADQYDILRADINNNLKPGKRPWPEQTAADFLHCLRFHNNDPELQKWLTFEELKEVGQTALHASIVKNVDTGELQTDEKQFKVYLETIKAREMLYKTDPTKQLYYSGGKYIDPDVLSEGAIHYSGKNIHSYFKRQKK